MAEEVLNVKKNNTNEAEQWCRKVAYFITQAGVSVSPTKLQVDILSKTSDNSLRHLAMYFLKCENWRFNSNLKKHSREELINEIKRVIQKARAKEISLKPPFEMKDFISPAEMRNLVGNVAGMTKSEQRVAIEKEAERLIDSGIITLPSSEGIHRLYPEPGFHRHAFRGNEIVILANSGNKLVPLMTPHLKDHFIEFFQKKQTLPKDKQDWISISGLLKNIRSSSVTNLREEIAKMRAFIDNLVDKNTNLAVNEGDVVPALVHIKTYARGQFQVETTMLSPEAQEYIRFNFYDSRKALTNGQDFLSPSSICKKLKLENSVENRALVQIVLKETREERKFEKVVTEIDGEEQTSRVGDLVKRLCSKSLRQPSFFIHKSALEEPFVSSDQAIIAKQMVVDRRNELRESKIDPADLLEQTKVRGR